MNLLRMDFITRRAGCYAAAILCVTLPPATLHAQAPLADTVITFDDLPANTALSNQYVSKGVTFGYPPYSSLPLNSQIPPGIHCCFPVVVTAPPGHATQAANISIEGGENFLPGMSGAFTTFRQRVQATIGGFSPGEQSSVTLSVFNINGLLVGRSDTRSLSAGPVTLIATIGSAEPSIAYFIIQTTIDESPIWVDDLTFDNPATPPPADFTLSDPIGAAGFWMSRGTSASQNIVITRLNGSNGNIAFGTGALPPGITASFTPNPAPGVTGSVALTLTAAPDAQLIRDAIIFVTASPATAAAGQNSRQDQVHVNLFPQFSIFGLADTLNLFPCTPADVEPIYFTKGVGFNEEVVLSVHGLALDGTAGPLPKGLTASFSPASFVPAGAEFEVLGLTINADFSLPDNALKTDMVLIIQGSTLGVTKGPLKVFPFFATPVEIGRLKLHIVPPVIDSLTPSGGLTPQSLKPGTQVLMRGSGFCSNDQVQFGSISSLVVPAPAITSTEILATIPRTGIPGPITVTNPAGAQSAGSQLFPVDTYRNTAAFSFRNYKPHITFDEMTTAFGRDQTYDTIDLCLIGCEFSFRDPGAMILNAIANAIFSGAEGGSCFGFALASQRFLKGQRSLGDFPRLPGGTTSFALDSPNLPGGKGGPSGPLTEYINSQVVSQLSEQVVGSYLTTVLGQNFIGATNRFNTIHEEIRAALAGGDHPMILLNHGITGAGGHVVVAYDLLDVSPGDAFIYVYDSNSPYLSVPTTDVPEVGRSRVEISNDRWTLSDTATNLNGPLTYLVVMPSSSVPVPPTILGAGLGSTILFGSANGAMPAPHTTQLADTTGHTLFDSSGQLNANPATRLQAAPFAPLVGSAATEEAFVVSRNAGAIVQTLQGAAAAPVHHTLMGSGIVATIDTASEVGISDQIRFDPAGTVGFQAGGGQKPLTLSVLARGVTGVQSAVVTSTSAQGGSDELRFDPGRSQVVFHHEGAAMSFRLRLTSLQKNGSPAAFESGPVQIAAGETATFTPANWSSLNSIPMTRRSPGGRERRTVLRNQSSTPAPGRVVALDLDNKISRGLGPRSLEIISRLGVIPPDSQVSVAWTVSAAGRKIAQHFETLTDLELVPGLRRDRFPFEAPQPGHYKVRADLVVMTVNGVASVARTSTRSAHLRIR